MANAERGRPHLVRNGIQITIYGIAEATDRRFRWSSKARWVTEKTKRFKEIPIQMLPPSVHKVAAKREKVD